jgi:hypothetical protein
MPSNKQKRAKSPEMPSLEIIDGGRKEEAKQVLKLSDVDIKQLASTSEPVTQRLNALKNDQLKYFELEVEFHEELHKLKCKYAKLYEPIFERRKKIVCGELEPNPDECKWPLEDLKKVKEENGDKSDAQKEKNTGI